MNRVLLMLAGCWLLGCSSPVTVIEIVDRSREANNDVWVCEGWNAESCRGEAEGDIDPAGWQRRVKVSAPPAAPEGCEHGAAAMHVVLKGETVVRVRYECAYPPESGGLPEAGGLPESAEQPPPSGLPEP